MTADSAIPCDTNSVTQCANENSVEDYLNDISLEYENIERKQPPWMKNWQKLFKIWFGATQNLKKLNLLNSVLPLENKEGLKPKLTLKFGEQSHIKLSQPVWNCRICRPFFAVIANMVDDLHKNGPEND